MIYWETLGPGIHADVTLTCTTHLNIVADQVPPARSPSRIPQQDRYAQKNIKKGSKLWSVLDTPLIPVQFSFSGTTEWLSLWQARVEEDWTESKMSKFQPLDLVRF